MSDQKKFVSYAAIIIGSAGLIASAIALTMYYSSLSPIILGGIDTSMFPLFGCALLGILSLVNKNLLNEAYDNICGKGNVNGKPKPFEEYKILVPAIVGAGVSFGIGAGLVALGLTSPIARTILTSIATGATVLLLINIIERSSSPPTPPGPSKKDPPSESPRTVSQHSKVDNVKEGHYRSDPFGY